MDPNTLERIAELTWRLPPRGPMNVPVVIYADETLVGEMDDKVLEQARNVTTLPGIVGACYVMPDGHWGYGFPIGGVAAFDAAAGGVVSAGGVGFDISCGVRCLRSGVGADAIRAVQNRLADALFHRIPVGVGSTGEIRLSDDEMDAMLRGGAGWAVERGWGRAEDLERIEEHGCMAGARPEHVSSRARSRQRNEMGTLGSGNHYLEVQRVAEVFPPDVADVFGLPAGDAVVSIHCGSRGLGHQIGTDYLRDMGRAAEAHGLRLLDRELASAPLSSELGQRYLGAMRAGINCALANRQIVTHLTRQVFADAVPDAELELVYDVSHNTCKEEQHVRDGEPRRLFVHRKGATRAFGPGHPGIRGIGPTPEAAFAQAALAMTGVITDPTLVEPREEVAIECEAGDLEGLLFDWIDALVFEMSTRGMLFSRFDVRIEDGQLRARIWGEPVDREKHEPAVEVKGPTFTELRVVRAPPAGEWSAQCVVDV